MRRVVIGKWLRRVIHYNVVDFLFFLSIFLSFSILRLFTSFFPPPFFCVSLYRRETRCNLHYRQWKDKCSANDWRIITVALKVSRLTCLLCISEYLHAVLLRLRNYYSTHQCSERCSYITRSPAYYEIGIRIIYAVRMSFNSCLLEIIKLFTCV